MRICTSLTVLSVTVSVLALAGCGGGSGGSQANVSTTLRSLADNESWTYLLIGTAGSTTSSTTSPINGTLTETVIATNLNGSAVMARVASGNYTIGSAPNAASYDIARKLYFSQDDSHNLVELGETRNASSATRITLGNNTVVPGTFGPSVSYSETVSFEDGSTRQHTFAVKSRERITVAAGTFDTWKCEESTTEGSLTTVETKWFAPELGAYVYDKIVQTDQSSGKKLSYTAVLTTTNTL